MRVDITFNDAAIEARLEQLQKEMPSRIKQALYDTAIEGQAIILKRTQRGRGLLGNFAKYSQDYAEFRRDKGRSTSQVNLRFYGNMLGALMVKSTATYAELYFAGAEQKKKAAAHHFGLGRLPARPFFGFNQNEKNQLFASFRSELRI